MYLDWNNIGHKIEKLSNLLKNEYEFIIID